MNEVDFEVTGLLRARQLVVHVLPDADVSQVGDGVTLDRRETREQLPSKLERGRRYDDVAVEKHLTGKTDGEKTLNQEPKPRSGGAEDDG